MEAFPLFKLLTPETQHFLRARASEQRFSHQTLKRLIDIARDIEMWQEGSIADYWPASPAPVQGPQKAKWLLAEVEAQWERLRGSAKDYRHFQPTPTTKEEPGYGEIPSSDRILGTCPVSSTRTRCCGLLTLDTARNCPYRCSYCSIQSFFHGNTIQVETRLREKLANLSLDPALTYHIGTGQSSDSLALGDRHGTLTELVAFARRHPNVILELKSKSGQVEPLLALCPPRNILCTWTINTPTLIAAEESGTDPLEARLRAARAAADRGLRVGFHFHPIGFYKGWEQEYREVAAQLLARFHPEEVALVSLGTFTFIRPLLSRIRARPIHTKVLQMPLVEIAGKLSYPAELKIRLFSEVYGALAPWHGKAFFYLCMEDPEIWKPALGFAFDRNADFEAAMKAAYLKKISV